MKQRLVAIGLVAALVLAACSYSTDGTMEGPDELRVGEQAEYTLRPVVPIDDEAEVRVGWAIDGCAEIVGDTFYMDRLDDARVVVQGTCDGFATLEGGFEIPPIVDLQLFGAGWITVERKRIAVGESRDRGGDTCERETRFRFVSGNVESPSGSIDSGFWAITTMALGWWNDEQATTPVAVSGGMQLGVGAELVFYFFDHHDGTFPFIQEPAHYELAESQHESPALTWSPVTFGGPIRGEVRVMYTTDLTDPTTYRLGAATVSGEVFTTVDGQPYAEAGGELPFLDTDVLLTITEIPGPAEEIEDVTLLMSGNWSERTYFRDPACYESAPTEEP